MPKRPKLRNEQVGQETEWYTEEDSAMYIGNVDTVPCLEARNRFNDHIKSLLDGMKYSKAKGRSAGELMHHFLDSISKNRNPATYYALGDSETFDDRFSSTLFVCDDNCCPECGETVSVSAQSLGQLTMEQLGSW